MGLVETLIVEAKEEGFKIGLKQARKKGFEQRKTKGKHSKKPTFVRSLIIHTAFDDEGIADVAGVDVNFVKKVRAEMRIEAATN